MMQIVWLHHPNCDDDDTWGHTCRAGPRLSSWPSTVPARNQHTEYVSLTENKARNMLDPSTAPECPECGLLLRGTSILLLLSCPANTRPSPNVIDLEAPLCVGCARLFRCVKDRMKEREMIEWITNQEAATNPHQATDAQLKASCKKLVSAMKQRAHQHYSTLPSNFVTAAQLYQTRTR